MKRRLRLRSAAALVPAGALVVVLAVATGAAPSSAATGSQVYTANLALSCVLAPGTLNVAGTVDATLQGTGPTSVSPGDVVSLTDVTTSLTTPAAWSTSFASLGATQAEGAVTSFILDTAGGTPASFNAGAALGSAGLPYGPAPVVTATPLTLTIPNSGPFTLQGVTVTGSAGGSLTLSVDTAPGFTRTGATYTATGQGIVSTAIGLNASGASVVGPLSVVCNAPTPAVVLGTIPIVASTGSTSTTSTTTTSTTSTTTTSSTTSTPDLVFNFNNWTLKGSVTDAVLDNAIPIPHGATFNGSADLTEQTITGNISVPTFTDYMSLLGIIPTSVGLTFTQDGPSTGTIKPDPTTVGDLDIAATSKATLGIISIGVLGINIPVSCQTSSPVVFQLDATEPALALTEGVTFTGKTTFPSITCGGLLGFLEGPIVSLLFSGANNPYSFTIAPPTTTTSTTTTAAG